METINNNQRLNLDVTQAEAQKLLQKDNKYPAKLNKEQAEDEAFWLKCIVKGNLAPNYNAAEEIWDSNTLMEDTVENKLFWSTVVEIYNEQSNAYREELEQKRIDSITSKYCGGGCEHKHHQENPELKGENIHVCFVCQKELVPEFPESFEKGSYQYKNALIVNMYGSYGMFVDQIPQEYLDEEDRFDPNKNIKTGLLGEYTAIICHDCAHDLCKKISWINKLIDPNNSHSHSYDQDWINHTGWDLPHRDDIND
ncbi:MAG TPA: hypothetical protein VMR51_00845 [Patescibacteria group bacterium]|nr:hypothetical protein [Patescibacteria group bacterium]